MLRKLITQMLSALGIDIDEDEGSEDESDDSEASDMSADCPVPCHCGSERCRLIAALVEKYDTEHEMLGEEAEMVELQAEVRHLQCNPLVSTSAGKKFLYGYKWKC